MNVPVTQSIAATTCWKNGSQRLRDVSARSWLELRARPGKSASLGTDMGRFMSKSLHAVVAATRAYTSCCSPQFGSSGEDYKSRPRRNPERNECPFARSARKTVMFAGANCRDRGLGSWSMDFNLPLMPVGAFILFDAAALTTVVGDYSIMAGIFAVAGVCLLSWAIRRGLMSRRANARRCKA
jgi:hypothetical protein